MISSEELKKILSSKINDPIMLKEIFYELKKEGIGDNSPYKIVDYFTWKPTYKPLTSDVIKKLRYDDKVVSCNATFKAFINIKGNDIFLDIGKGGQLFLPLTEKYKKEFCLNIVNGKYTCEGEIRYSPDLNMFTVHHLTIFIHKNCFEKWCDIFSLCQNQNELKQRIDFLLNNFGLNPNNMTFEEIEIFFLRLVPLVVNKYLMIDLSKPEIGKTELYRLIDFNLYTNAITRSSAFIDGRNGKTGDFFSENIVYIIDEIGKVYDEEVITSLQVYKNGDKNWGTIQAGSRNIKSSTSVVILGNPKIKVNYHRIYIDKINLFENTIINKNDDSSAFLSRTDALLPSYGCRTFNSTMKNDKGINRDFIEIFKNSLSELREKDIDIAKLFNKYQFSINFDSNRDEISIYKTLEGLLKIFYPELLLENYEFINWEIINFFLCIAKKVRNNVNNQIAIINGEDVKNKFTSCSNYRNAYFKNCFGGEHFYSPHRLFIKTHRSIIRIPLDTIGIELNKQEESWFRENYLNCQYKLKSNGELILYDTNKFELPRLELFKSEFSNYNLLTGEEEEKDLVENFVYFQGINPSNDDSILLSDLIPSDFNCSFSDNYYH